MTNQSTLEIDLKGNAGSLSLDIAFSVPLRGTTALFGRSGSGKTTILRWIAGLEAFPGYIKVGSEVWQDSTKGIMRQVHERPIGYVFQEASLFPHLNVLGNLTFGQRRRGNKSAAESLPIAHVADLLGLSGLMSRKTMQLSGGERQRVAIGRALLSNPEMLLMDEPLSALDHASKGSILAYLERIQKDLNIPTLFVSHDFGEVLRLADHMVVIENGKKILDGPAGPTFERLDFEPPEGRHETSVVVPAEIISHDRPSHVTRFRLGQQVITAASTDGPIGAQVSLRVRARDVALALDPPKNISIRNILAGNIVEIIERPNRALMEALIDVDGFLVRSQITRHAVIELDLKPGQHVYALIKSVSLDNVSSA